MSVDLHEILEEKLNEEEIDPQIINVMFYIPTN